MSETGVEELSYRERLKMLSETDEQLAACWMTLMATCTKIDKLEETANKAIDKALDEVESLASGELDGEEGFSSVPELIKVISQYGIILGKLQGVAASTIDIVNARAPTEGNRVQ